MDHAASDHHLLARIAKRDDQAMADLFVRHRTRILRFITRMTGNAAIAEELTTDVFIDVWCKAGSFRGHSTVLTWLLTIARNKTVSAMRRRSELSLELEYAKFVADTADTPETSAHKAVLASRIRAYIARLSREHQEVIDLLYYHQRSIAEVSAIVGIPENTVKSRAFHARRKLFVMMQNAGIECGAS